MVGTLQADMLLEAEVAEMLRLSVKAVRRERERGRLGFHKVAGRIRISRADVERYLAAQWHEPAKALISPVEPASGTSPGRTAAGILSGGPRGREIARSLRLISPRSSSSSGSR